MLSDVLTFLNDMESLFKDQHQYLLDVDAEPEDESSNDFEEFAPKNGALVAVFMRKLKPCMILACVFNSVIHDSTGKDASELTEGELAEWIMQDANLFSWLAALSTGVVAMQKTMNTVQQMGNPKTLFSSLLSMLLDDEGSED